MECLSVALAVAAFACAVVGTLLYAKLAARLGIVAVPNERTLHVKHVPRGGGVAISVPFLVAMVVLYVRDELPVRWFLALVPAGALLAVVGFIDDVVEVSAKIRFALHMALGVWVVACVGHAPTVDFGSGPVELGVVGVVLSVLGVVWMINLYNFIDGIDGMAASSTVYVSAISAALLASSGVRGLAGPLAILGAAALAFLCFNWPPARLFMGDTGSAFLGYVFGTFVLLSMGAGVMSLWTWIIVMGYALGDTTTTMIVRAVKVKGWWNTHRSHAYQNLARVWGNHRRMTLLTIAIDVLWLAPLALASVRWPHQACWIAALAVAPVVVFTLKFGPLYDK